MCETAVMRSKGRLAVRRSVASGSLIAALASIVLATFGSTAPGPPRTGVKIGVTKSALDSIPPAALDCIDTRTGADFNYFAQHLLSTGALDINWNGASGVLCLGTSSSLSQQLCPDGSGGVYAAWVDNRRPDSDIYLQHFDSQGAIVSGWASGGQPVCTALGSQYNLSIASDGNGGLYLAWQDFRGPGPSAVYAQRMTAVGTPAQGWPVNGLRLCSTQSEQDAPAIAATVSGALVVWQDRRSGALQLFSQAVTAGGTLASGWSPDGIAVSAGGAAACAPALAADSTGRATLVWTQQTGEGPELLAARLSVTSAPSGTVTPVAVASGASEDGAPSVTALADGSALIAWPQWQGQSPSLRIQRLASSGAVDLSWPAGGLVVSSSALSRYAPFVLPQIDGGALIGWQDFRSGSGNIYVNRVSSTGSLADSWPAQGTVVSPSATEQYAPALLSDGALGAYVTWADASQSGQGQLFSAEAPLSAGSVTLVAAEAHAGHAHLVWRVRGKTTASFEAFRQVGIDGQVESIARCVPNDTSCVVLDDHDPPGGADVSYRLGLVGDGFEQFLTPVTLKIPRAPLRLALHRAWGLPGQSAIAMSMAVPLNASPAVDLIDVMGRRMERRVFEGLDAGEQTVLLPVSGRLASGVYFLRVAQGPDVQTAKVVFIR